MYRLRRTLGRLAAAWLIFQVATLTFAPVDALLRAGNALLLECSCAHTDHGMCPMHHTATAPSRPGECLMKSAHDGSAAIVSVFLGPVGLVPGRTPELAPSGTGTSACAAVHTTTLRPGPPDPPPPRA